MSDEMVAAAKRTRRNTQIALRQMAGDGKGGLSKNARLVLASLSRFCDGDGRHAFPRNTAGDIDQTAMVRMAGRREVFDFLTIELGLKLDERHNLQD